MDDEVLGVEVTYADRSTVVVVTGEIDADSVLSLHAAMSEISPRTRIALDMSGVRFMDCSAIRVLLTQRIEANEAGGSIHVRDASAAVQRVLHLSGLEDILGESDAPQ